MEPVVVWVAKPGTVKTGLVSNAVTNAQDGAYLAGVLAAKSTKTGKLGIVISAGRHELVQAVRRLRGRARAASTPT